VNTLDIVLCGFALVYALSGYQQGFIVGAAATSGLLIGGFVGVEVTPTLLENFTPGLSLSVAALVLVLFCAFAGQAIGAFVGSQLRSRVTWRPARTVDAIGGKGLIFE